MCASAVNCNRQMGAILMRHIFLVCLASLCLGLAVPAFAQQSSPQITSVSPSTARAGDQILITGSGFGSSQGNGNVWLGSTYGVVVSWSDSQVVAAVASGSKTGVAQILQGGVWSNAADFTVITPNISSVTPTTAIAGTQITITGTGFGASQGSGNVWLGSTYGVVASWSDSQIVANVASGSKTGVAQVLQGGVWSNTVNLTVSTPNITSVTPTTAIAGTQITVTGTGFGASQGGGNVWLGSTYGVVVSWSDTQIVANVATGSKSGVAQVLQGGVWSNTVNLTVSTPNITGVTPTTAIAGTQITITGTGFGASQGSGNVWLGTTYGVIISWSDTQIVANVASGSKTGVAQVLQGGVWSNIVNLTVSTPNIVSVTPTTAIAGTQITITGTGFGASQGSGNVWLGSTYGVVASWSDSQIVANVASGSKTGVAQVLQGCAWSNTINLTVSTPNMTSVTPTTAIAGTQITVTGTGFGASQGGGNVWLGSTYGVVVSWSDTQIVANVATGSKSGVAQVLQGGVWSNTVNLTVSTPNITGVTPTTAIAGTQITITGTGFGASQGSGNVWLGTTYGVVISWSDTQIVANVASGSKTGVAQVLQGGVWSKIVNLTVSTPNITSVTPTTAIAGTQITITGTGFGASQGSGNVWLGSTYGVILSWSDTQIVANVASGSKSGVAQVLQGGVWSNTVNLTVNTPNITSVTPTTAIAGTQITIVGTGFGASQGSGNVWLGSTYGVVISWSDTQIVANVASGSKSGVAQVLQGGVWSNTVNLTVSTPNITSVTPTTAIAGTQITITGIGFGATQGSGNVWLGSTYGVVVSWSDTQVVANVAAGSSTGVAQVLQGGVWSNTVTLTIGSGPNITSVSPTSAAIGTPVTITGTGFGNARGTGSVLLGSINGLVATWSDTQIVALVAPNSTSATVQVLQGGSSSNVLSFTVATPAVTSVTPASGTAGTQITIIGSGFGATQGTGRVTLGTAYGVVVSWSDTQVVATIAPGSSSGTAQIIQGGLSSNSVNFTVITPMITSVSPTTATAGTQVTISGSGFGPAQANGKVWLGTAYGSVVSWSDTQVTATVATGSAAGTAQILQNGVWSNSLPFSTGLPQINTVTPASAVPGSQVTISGSSFGTSQGAGTLRLGSSNGLVVSWSDTQIVGNVASQSVTGIVRVTQNEVSSNSIRFVVPTVGSANNAFLVPSVLSMIVGETHSIQALDTHSQPIPGLTWTSSDSTVVSLSTDDPPVLTALAPGHVTITAGDSSADVTVLSASAALPGTVLWSSPGDGSGIVQAIPAVPSYTGVADVFALQASGNVQAVTADGKVAWTATAGAGNTLLPDFQGGLVVSAHDSVKRFDGMTGQTVFTYAFANPDVTSYLYRGKHPVAVHPDGTVFLVDGDKVVGLDSQTGTVKFSVSLDDSSYSASSDCRPQIDAGISGPPFLGPSIIAGDGYFYIPYEFLGKVDIETYYDPTSTPPTCNWQQNLDSHLRLLRVGTDGSVQKTNLGDWTGYDYFIYGESGFHNTLPNGDFESLITNADKGVLFTWSLIFPEGCAITGPDGDSGCSPNIWDIKVTDTSTGATTSTGHTLPAPVLQAQDGTFIGNAINTDDWYTINVAGFNPDGSVKWTGPTNYQALLTTSDGGLLAKSDSGQYVTFDPGGNIIGQVPTPPTLSWTGGAYQTGPGSLDSVVPDDIELAETFASVRGPISLIDPGFLENGLYRSPNGNVSGNGAAILPITNLVRKQIAVEAVKNLGSTQWLDTPERSLCNIFAHDMLRNTGANAPESAKGSRWLKYNLGFADSPKWPAQAGDWANPGLRFPGWIIVQVPANAPVGSVPSDYAQAGDVIAERIGEYGTGATGHVGIVSQPKHTISGDSAVNCYAFPTPSGTITDSDYGFRSADWVDPFINPTNGRPCRNYGRKANAVVRRFVGR